MSTKILYILTIFIFVFQVNLYADGFIIPQPGNNISVKYHHVNVEISNQTALTTIDQVFINDSDTDNIEAVYVFPLPKGAAVSDFSMFVDGEEIHAEILDADSARAFYESIVRQQLDPALLEYAGQNLIRARIFPMPAGGERRVKVSYNQVLDYDSGLFRYLYPLNTEKFSFKPLEEVSITVILSSSNPIKSTFSPSHSVTVQKIDDNNVIVTYGEENVKPDIDFILYYAVSADDIGVNVLTHNPADDNGFYLFLASPKYEIDDYEVIAKRIFFVIDRSGSMSGEKIVQAKDALKFCVNNLNPEDHFNIIDFASEITTFNAALLQANAANIQSALNYISGITAGGGTNINEALLTALSGFSDDSVPNIIIFLTDGQPTVGETNNAAIRNNIKTANNHETRLFSFGVGYDVNSTLLDQLSEENNGTTTYVSPIEDIEIAVSSFFTKVNNPILTGLTLDYGNIEAYDYFPKKLPDLFKGSQIAVIGRYQESGNSTLTLQGNVRGIGKTYQYEVDFPAANMENDFLPRLWATRKVGYLLDMIRLEGENQELIDEIIALGKKYGIITPYTSFLIYEDDPSADNWDLLGDETGQDAFNNAVNNQRYRNASNTNDIRSTEVRYAGNKTFFMRDSFWVDSQLDSSLPVIDVEFASDLYFDIVNSNMEMGRYFSIGKNIVIVYNNQIYQVHEADIYYNIDPHKLIPRSFGIEQNYPNPFNSVTTIKFTMNRKANVNISVYNILGRKVAELYDNYADTGEHKIKWEAQGFASGLYFYKIQSEGSSAIFKMILIK